MIEIICDEDSFFSFQRRNILSKLNARQLKLYNQINKYLEEYLKFYNIGPKKVIGLYKRFLKSYALDCKQFIETNYYPAGLTGKINELDRMEYDIILIISCLLSFHRFRIIDEISNYKYISESSLFIGIGPGLEVFLIKDRFEKFDAYDLEISDFIKNIFNKNIYEKKFTFKKRTYKNIFAIEILEHLEKPYELLGELYNSLDKEGIISLTTAKNIPQFDHLYNFENENDFLQNIEKIGFQVVYRKLIEHQSSIKELNANNIFYRLKRI